VRGGLTAVDLAPTAVAAAHWCPHAQNNQDLAAVKFPNVSLTSSPGVAHPDCGSLGAPRLAGACSSGGADETLVTPPVILVVCRLVTVVATVDV